MKQLEMNRIKEVSKKTVADFVRSETGSVGVKNAATLGAFAGILALSQSSSEAVVGTTTVTLPDGTVIVAI